MPFWLFLVTMVTIEEFLAHVLSWVKGLAGMMVQTDRQTDRQTERQTDRQTDRQRYRQEYNYTKTNRQTNHEL